MCTGCILGRGRHAAQSGPLPPCVCAAMLRRVLLPPVPVRVNVSNVLLTPPGSYSRFTVGYKKRGPCTTVLSVAGLLGIMG